MSNDEKISTALSLLEEAAAEPLETPAVVVMPPDSCSFIIGNKRGFVHLAVAARKASSGEEQPFKKQPWATADDLDWTVNGPKYDASAHIYLPDERSQSLLQSGIGWLLPLVVAICLIVGFCIDLSRPYLSALYDYL